MSQGLTIEALQELRRNMISAEQAEQGLADDTRPTVQITTAAQERSGRVAINMTLPEIRIMQLCYPHMYVGSNAEHVEENIKAMKRALEQKFYGDAQCALQAVRLTISNILGIGSTDQCQINEALDILSEKLQLRANVDITEL